MSARRRRWPQTVAAVSVAAAPAFAILVAVAATGDPPLAIAAVDWLSAGLVSLGGLSAGVVSVGVVSTGVVSIGVVSFGVVSVGIVSSGTIALGLWAAGSILTKPISPRLWESKFALSFYDADRQRAVVEPLRKALGGTDDARLLDLACGTGRITRLVLDADWFSGTIEATDGAPGMVERLETHLDTLPAERRARVTCRVEDLSRGVTRKPKAADAITLMEVSEMLPNLRILLEDIAATLKPGGLLLLTRTPAPFGWAFPGRHQSRRAMRAALDGLAFERVEFVPWTRRYEIVTAWKPATPPPR